MKKIAVNWYEEKLHKFYEDDNQGLIHGVYHLDEEDQVQDVVWFKTIEEQKKRNRTIRRSIAPNR